jgi:hypothetical protein
MFSSFATFQALRRPDPPTVFLFFVTRFLHELCTDRGRAINQAEPGWERTLTGQPKELYAFWEKPASTRIPPQSTGGRFPWRNAG